MLTRLDSNQTKGPSLEQIALLFDGKDATVAHVNPVAEEFLEGKSGKGEKNEVETMEVEVVR